MPLVAPNPDHLAQIYGQINAARERRGLSPYRWNDALSRAAQNQAEWLISTHSRTHVRADGSRPSTRAAAQGFYTTHWCCGENYYMSIDATPDLVFNFWMGSSSHVVNVVHRDFTDVGLGMSGDGNFISYVTVFGQLDDPNAPPPPAESAAPAPAPDSAPPAAPPIEGGQIIYVVSGDTLARIALRYGTSVGRLIAANNLANPNLIFPGQQLIIPPPS